MESIMIEEACLRMRKNAIHITHNLNSTGAHIGGTLSLIEIMAVLYLDILKYDVNNMTIEDRDRLILSKGHGALAQYAAMCEAGIITSNYLYSYKHNNNGLPAHPSIDPKIGIEFSSGSLGQGLSLGVGCCLGLKRKNNDTSRVFVILGDGECNEGSVWEAAESASHFNCKNLIAIIDRNKIQYDGLTANIMNDSPLDDKFISFGWNVIDVDGHNVKKLQDVLQTKYEKSTVVIANTIKGKGVSFMENNPLWHNHSLNKEQYEMAISELEAEK